MNEQPISKFEKAIQATHGCGSALRARVEVQEGLVGDPVWEGEVLVFDLIGHPTALTCYAWSVGSEVVAVLHEGRVKSPEKAVRASITEARSPGRGIGHPMEKASKGSEQPTEDQWEPDEALRQDLGLSPLGDGEELTDDDSS